MFLIGQGDSTLMHTLSNKAILKPHRSKYEKGLSTEGMKVGIFTSSKKNLDFIEALPISIITD